MPDDAGQSGSRLCLISRSTGLVATSCEIQRAAGVLCQGTTYDQAIPISFPTAVDDPNFTKVFILPSDPTIRTIVALPGYVKKQFFTVEGLFTWAEASESCGRISGNPNSSLAVISSITEYQLLRNIPDFMTFENNGYWVGLRRHPDGLRSPLDQDGINAAFLWLDGSPLNYFAFIPLKPRPNTGIEKCVAIAKEEKSGSIGYRDYRCLVADDNGDILDWNDEDDLCFGALCQYDTDWL